MTIYSFGIVSPLTPVLTGAKNGRHSQPAATYIVAGHILSPATVYGDVHGTYCRQTEYIVADEYMPGFTAHIVARLHILSLFCDI